MSRPTAVRRYRCLFLLRAARLWTYSVHYMCPFIGDFHTTAAAVGKTAAVSVELAEGAYLYDERIIFRFLHPLLSLPTFVTDFKQPRVSAFRRPSPPLSHCGRHMFPWGREAISISIFPCPLRRHVVLNQTFSARALAGEARGRARAGLEVL